MGKKYKAAIVTPFHNVDMAMFKECAASVKAQTLGFSSIQWVIVVHNCEEHYMGELESMFQGCDNVLLKELNNDAHTPSSPRNYGTTFVEAPYIGYLDGDDSYTPDCLEVAVREAEETGAQMVWFRREVEKEDPSMVMPPALSHWDHTRKRIVIDHDTWDDKKMFSGLFGFATSFIYSTDFLKDKDLSFSESMFFGEDFLFVVEASAAAERICFLPQHIGYHYFVNGHSMVQTGEKTADMIQKYAEGFRNLFRIMRSYGIDTQENSQIQCAFVIVRFIIGSPKLTVSERTEIMKLLSDDVLAMRLLPPDKNFDAITRLTMLKASQSVILNPENPFLASRRINLDGEYQLDSILMDNLDTDMGKRYSFGSISSIEAYQFRVPLTDVKYYEPLLKLQINVGEKEIMTKAPITRYFRSQEGRLIPSTDISFKPYGESFASLLKDEKNLLIGRSYPIWIVANDGACVDTLGSAIIKSYFVDHYLKGGVLQASFSSGIEAYFKQDQEENGYFDLMADALASRDITQIAGITVKDVLEGFQTLEKNWSGMIEKIADPDRKKEVAAILEEGFEKPVAERLWPALKKVTAFGAGEFYESAKELKRYTGLLPCNNGFYFIEEAVVGKATGDDTNLFECINYSNFYEFLPVNELDEETVHAKTWTQVECGKPYFLIVTNHAGLYRYRTDHTIVPREISDECIRFTVY